MMKYIEYTYHMVRDAKPVGTIFLSPEQVGFGVPISVRVQAEQ